MTGSQNAAFPCWSHVARLLTISDSQAARRCSRSASPPAMHLLPCAKRGRRDCIVNPLTTLRQRRLHGRALSVIERNRSIKTCGTTRRLRWRSRSLGSNPLGDLRWRLLRRLDPRHAAAAVDAYRHVSIDRCATNDATLLAVIRSSGLRSARSTAARANSQRGRVWRRRRSTRSSSPRWKRKEFLRRRMRK